VGCANSVLLRSQRPEADSLRRRARTSNALNGGARGGDEVPPALDSGGAGSRTRVRMRAAVAATCVFRCLISPAGARADAIPGQPVLVLSRPWSRARLPGAIPLICGPSATRERAGDRPVGLTRPERSCRWQLLCSRPQYGGSGHRHATIHVHSPVETVSPPFVKGVATYVSAGDHARVP
jgi:hypothetical protein